MSVKTSHLPYKTLIRRQVEDAGMQTAIANAQDTITTHRQKVLDELGDTESWRDRAAQLRKYVLENLDALLYQLSENVTLHGGHIFFAKTKEEATDYILAVARQKEAKTVVKAKSMVTEEIGLNDAFAAEGIQVTETDLAEYILQVARDAPSHVVVPAIHKDRHQIRQLFHDRLGYEGSDTPEEMTRFVRSFIREDFFKADIGITGCNFAVAESGSVCLVTNEGNARLCTTLPKTHIAVMGMERIVPQFRDVDIMITLLARNAVGLRLTGYNTWLTGPRQTDESDGPEDFHLVVVDNGRSTILGSAFNDILRCIRCGACMNTCPAYRHIGGQGYASIYPGPVGAVLTPLLGGYQDFSFLPHICSLCTACDAVCPVKIPLSALIRKHREEMVKQHIPPTGERIAIKAFSILNSHPGLWRVGMMAGAPMARWFIRKGRAPLNIGILREWTRTRDLPTGDGESFRSWFREHQKEHKND